MDSLQLLSLLHRGKRSSWLKYGSVLQATAQAWHGSGGSEAKPVPIARCSWTMSQAAGKRGTSTMRAPGGRLFFVSMGTVGEEGRHSGRERGTKEFPCMRWTASLPAGKRKSGLPSQKSRPLFAYAYGAKSGITDAAPGFSGVCVVSLRPQSYLLGNSSRAFSAKRRPKISKSALHSS